MKPIRYYVIGGITAGLLTCLPIHSYSQVGGVPRQMSYQGVLREGDKVPTDGMYSVTIALYDRATAGQPLWQETQTVEVKGGLFNIILGQYVNLPAPLPTDAWIGISFNSSQEMSRTKLTSSAYSFNAVTAQSLMTNATGAVLSVNGQQGNLELRAADGLEVRSDKGVLTIGKSSQTKEDETLNQGTEWILAGNGNANANSWLGTNNNIPLIIRTNNTERMRILSSNGNVGIGENNPGSRLSVARTLHITNTGGTPELRLSAPSGVNGTTFKTTGQSANITYTLPPDDGDANDVLMSNGSGVLTWADNGWLRDGNSDNNSNKFIGTTNNQPFIVKTNNIERYRVTGGGAMGINEDNPTQKLEVAGNIVIKTDGSGTGELRLQESSGNMGNNYTGFKAGNLPTNLIYTLPTTSPLDGQILSSNTQGILTWSTPGAAGSAGGDLAGNYPNPTIAQKGANTGEVLKWDGTEWNPATDIDGSLQYFTEARNTTAPNATVPVHQLLASGTETNIDIALTPKGTGALTAQIADNTTTGGNKRGVYAVDWQMQRGANTQVASGSYSVVGGGFQNTASGSYSVVGGGLENTASGYASTIGGGLVNLASEYASTVGGGAQNTASADYSTVGGGVVNLASEYASTVGGGFQNTASGSFSTVGGGSQNTASGYASTVGGGFGNTASGDYSTISGGRSNTASGDYSAISGGRSNTASGDYSAIPGGRGLTLDASADRSFGFHGNTTAGDRSMTISVANTAVLGNVDLWLANNDNTPRALRFYELYNTAGAYPNGANYVGFRAPNSIASDVTWTLPNADGTSGQVLSTNGSGTLSWANDGVINFTSNRNITAPNATVPVHQLIASGTESDIDIALTPKGTGALTAQVADNGTSGGNKRGTRAVDWQMQRDANTQVASGNLSTVGGGSRNTASGYASTIGGGYENTASDSYSVVGGGYENTASDNFSTIGGGQSNTASGDYATIGGGQSNMASAQLSTVGGGQSNTTSGPYSVVGGGFFNTASGGYSVVGGGFDNTASADYSTVGGGGFQNTASGNYSTVLGGRNNTANGEYNLVFGNDVDPSVTEDYRVYLFDATNPGMIALNREDADHPIHVGTDATNGNGAHLTAGGSWTNGSSMAFKDRFTALDGDVLLDKLHQLDIKGWYYKGTNEFHIGPVAEQFYSLFQTGDQNKPEQTEKYISSVDPSGVALAGVKELLKRVEELSEKNQNLEEQNKKLMEAIEEIKAMLKK